MPTPPIGASSHSLFAAKSRSEKVDSTTFRSHALFCLIYLLCVSSTTTNGTTGRSSTTATL
jgi:hypothetical protein